MYFPAGCLSDDYLALIVVFNAYVSPQEQAPVSSEVCALITQELGEVSSEALVAHLLLGQELPWSVDEHAQAVLNRPGF